VFCPSVVAIVNPNVDEITEVVRNFLFHNTL